MFLALREIRHEPVRFTLIISVITLVAYLTFFLASLAVGLAHRYRAGIDGWNTASVAVTDASNENLSASRLSDKQLKAATDLAKDNGTTASALMSTAAVAQAPDVKDEDGEALREDVFAFGIDLDGQLSPPVADGRTISAPDSEVLVDDSLKAKGLAVGDTIRLLGSDHDWTVVGFTHDTTFQAAPVVTMDSRALRQHGPTTLPPAAPDPIGFATARGDETGPEADRLRTAVAGGGPAGLGGGFALQPLGDQELGDAGGGQRAVVAGPGHRLPLAQGAVVDAQQRQAAQEG